MNDRVVVLGGGTMGAGIAYVFALNGFHVEIIDPSSTSRESCSKTIKHVAQRARERDLIDESVREGTLDRISINVDLADVAHQPMLLIEAVPEDPELKIATLTRAQEHEPAILATNTSSISIAELARNLKSPEKFIGMHFFNPVWSNPLVEIVVGDATSEDVIAETKRLIDVIGKDSITVRDSPGFASSRLGVALGLEAIRMLGEGVASAEDIDRAMELGYRHPMGPLRLTDLVGLDVRLGIARNLARAYGSRFDPPQLLIDKVNSGELGKKTGRGFFDW